MSFYSKGNYKALLKYNDKLNIYRVKQDEEIIFYIFTYRYYSFIC